MELTLRAMERTDLRFVHGLFNDRAVMSYWFEEPFDALAELEDIVRRLERGDVPLDESVAIYERGEALKMPEGVEAPAGMEAPVTGLKVVPGAVS